MVHGLQVLVPEENAANGAHLSVERVRLHSMRECLHVEKAKLRAAASEHWDLSIMKKVLKVYKIIQESSDRANVVLQERLFQRSPRRDGTTRTDDVNSRIQVFENLSFDVCWVS
jgi:hypothetical protein